jgi:hypothetical protein
MGAAFIAVTAIFVLGFLPGYFVGYVHGGNDEKAKRPEPEPVWGEDVEDG